VLVTLTGELEILWPVRVEHGAETFTTGSLRAQQQPSSSGRTHLPSLRWILSAKHSFLRPVRSKHDVVAKGTTRLH